MKILQINASAKREGSESTRLANAITARLRAAEPKAELLLRDLAREPMPALDDAALSALFTPASERSAEQAARVALDDAAIAEIQSAEVVVLGCRCTTSVCLPSSRTGSTRSPAPRSPSAIPRKGPRVCSGGKKVYVALTRGGRYRDTPADSQVPYLKTVFAFLGMTDAVRLCAEGLAMGRTRRPRRSPRLGREIESLAA